MNHDFTLEFRGDHIHVQHAEDYEISPESLTRLWQAVNEACEKYNCRRVLAEATTPPRRVMSMMDAYRSAIQAMKIRGLNMACSLAGYVPDQQTEFFKTSALNRGVRIEFFSDRAQALEWLSIDVKE